MAIDLRGLQDRLQEIEWGTGLTRDAIRLRWPELPEEVYMHLPSEKRFSSANNLVGFLGRRLALAESPEIPEGGATDDGGPADWGESSTGATLETPDLGHGVGSGANPGYTGGGSVQTGVGREGTTYGDAESNPLPDRR
jgi:hypothetical protein